MADDAPNIRGEVLGTLEGWLQGYSDPDAQGRQWRIRIIESHEDSIVIRIEPPSFSDLPDRYYGISVEVTELEPPADTSELPAHEAVTDGSGWIFRD
jgi:hypothetical protein